MIIREETEEASRRIRARVCDVVVWELKEIRKQIRRARIEEVETSKRIYDFIPTGNGEKKTLVEIT